MIDHAPKIEIKQELKREEVEINMWLNTGPKVLYYIETSTLIEDFPVKKVRRYINPLDITKPGMRDNF